MVSYQEWFGIVHRVASSKGDLSRSDRSGLTSDLADYWRENRADLERLSRSDAEQLADEIVTV